MKVEIKIPDIAENVESGIVAGILVSEGDQVNEDQPVIEVETDKAATDIPSTHSGTVKEIRVKEGDEVKVGQVIMVLETGEGEDAGGEEKEGTEEKEAEKEEAAEKGEEADKEEAGGKQGEKEKEKKEKEAEEKHPAAGEDIPASPSVRRLARESGVDLKKVRGTGPGNRITAGDVKSAAEEKEKGEPGGPAPEEKATRESMSRIRSLTAGRMKKSWQQIPHVTQFDEADVTRMEEFRQQHKDAYEQRGGKLTITAILLKLTAFALQRFPRFNASIDEEQEEIIYKQTFHIGVAVDTDRGLLVPVVRDVDRKPLDRLAAELTELAEKTQNKKISPDDLQGGTFTISNLGGIGGTAFTPIVYSPQVAILGISRGQYKQIYRKGEFEKRLILPLSLSYDHRVIDGAEGARFLRWICQVLEDPYAILQ